MRRIASAGRRRGRGAVAVGALAVLASVAPAGADLFAVIDRGTVYRSTNDGISWSAVGSVTEPTVAALQPGLVPGTMFLAGRAGDVQRSDDDGVSWSVAGNAGASDCADLAIMRAGQLVILTRTGDLIASSDGGASWTPAANAGFSDGAALAVGGVTAAAAETLFAATASGDIARSIGVASWSIVGNTGFTPVVDIVWADGVLWALTDAGETIRSSDAGATWSAVGTLSQVGMRALTFAGSQLRAISREGDAAGSASGAAWFWLGTLNQVFVVAMAPRTPAFATGVPPPDAAPRLTLDVWPNPFTREARFAFSGGRAGESLELAIYDLAGRRVARLHSGAAASPSFTASWRPDGLPSGVYVARLSSGAYTESRRVVLLR